MEGVFMMDMRHGLMMIDENRLYYRCNYVEMSL